MTDRRTLEGVSGYAVGAWRSNSEVGCVDQALEKGSERFERGRLENQR